MGLLRCLRHWKKFVLIFAAVYCVLCRVAYRHFWKDGVRILEERTFSVSDGLLMSFWNNNRRLSRSDIIIDRPSEQSTKGDGLLIAIGSGITSRGLHDVNHSNIGEKFQFFNTFLPTFCHTASPQFIYRLYLGYDISDRVFADQRLRDAFLAQFQEATSTSGSCRDRRIATNLSLVRCDHAGKPAWAQNDAMLEAYLDHVDYFYRVNDDTRMVTDGWTEKFISTLEGCDPPRVGVVGPNHSGGNVAILTYDFVHRTHVDIFGFYYPRVFSDWWGDTWITRVYKPNRSIKIATISLAHTLGLGQRYGVHWRAKSHLGRQLAHDAGVLKRYINAMKRNKASGVKADGRKVISMSLYGKDPRYTWGVIRNAQLIPVYLPDWTLRVYVAADPAPSELAVPPRIINKLQLLGAVIVKVSTGNGMSPRNWRHLVVKDEQLDYFLVRDADSRLSEREAAAVKDWLSASENGSQSAVVHCIRDHPKHSDQAIVDGLWGGRPRALHQLLRQDTASQMMMNSIASNASSSSSERRTGDVTTLLNQVLWPAVSNLSYCHDSVSPCSRWLPLTSRRAFPLPRQTRQYMGQKFDAHQELLSTDGDQLKPDVLCNYRANSILPTTS